MRLSQLILVLVLLHHVESVLANDWPMYRKNSGRTAVSKSEMPSDLRLGWTRQLPPLEPAFHNERLQFDAGYEPVSAGGMLLIASSRTDSVTAYSVVTGEQGWTFRTNGPVRCAPAIWQDRVCFGSDDGYLYCLELKTGKLCWKHRAAPSDRRLLGNGRLISVWPVRGGPVVTDGQVYFAAGVWPFEGVFVYSMEIATGSVNWRNDAMSYMFGQQPHNTQAIGGLAPQGYLLINQDELIVPCSTAYPARLNRHDGTLIDFELPSPARMPGGWFAQLDPDTSRALRRGTITYDALVNRQEHEDREQLAPGGLAGLSRQIRSGDTTWNFDEGFPGVDGKIHSMIVADNRVIVVTQEGTLSCFEPKSESEHEAKYWHATHEKTACGPQSLARAKTLGSYAGNKRGIAMVLGLETGELVHALVQDASYQVIAIDDDSARVDNLRDELQTAGIGPDRAAVLYCDLSKLELPPYLATLITTERFDKSMPSPLQTLRPFGGMCAMGGSAVANDVLPQWLEQSELGNFASESIQGELVVRRTGALPGATQYAGNWAASEDPLVRFPLGVLWFDDTLAHFKRSPQPRFVDDVMISQPKNWHVDRFTLNNTLDYPLLSTVLSDIYTGRVLAEDEKAELRGNLSEIDPVKLEPSQYRPPQPTEPMNPKQPAVGQRINPLTGLTETRVFPKTYGCDGGVDYGLFFTMRSGTPAFYDKTLESGTVFLSGPRSGCTNSIIPSGGLLNVPYFYEGCTCSYPLPAAMSLVSMPERFEQWSSWGDMQIPARSIQRLGVNLGAPGDRMTRHGTLWLDYPSVGGPSPAIELSHTPANVNYRYRHSMWMSQEDNQPWVTASMAEGLESLLVKDLKPGKYQVSLYFAEPDPIQPGERVQNVQLQGKPILEQFDILAETGAAMQGVVVTRHGIDVEGDGLLRLQLTSLKGTTLISGLELQLETPAR